MYKKLFFAIALSVPGLTGLTGVYAQSDRQPSSGIRVDQLGFYPQASKIAVVVYADPTSDLLFYILSADAKDTVFTGRLGPLKRSANSSLQTRIADFSTVRKEGSYRVSVPGIENSFSFRIGKEVLRPLATAALKGYYYLRSGQALEPAYAGKWSRPEGHPDIQVLVHPSAASAGRPAGTVISTPGGWYDAGDYNKYIVNSGITMGTLLSAYEDFPAYFDGLHTNIPGDGTPLPDMLKECLYNLRWMLAMQDPSDGGVYNKCTNAAFDGMVMPDVTKAPRWVVQKGTAATLDFAAVTAQAGRILKKWKSLSALSDSCLTAAAAAWQWAIKNPALAYDQNAINRQYEPKISTGGYGDRNFRDEWFWAASELAVSFMTDSRIAEGYRKVVEERIGDTMTLPSWANVRMLGDYTLLRYRGQLPGEIGSFLDTDRNRLLALADSYLDKVSANAFQTVMGQSPRDFVWGSNSVAANQGILLINAWLQTRDKKYLDNALGNLDYLLGRNATGYCFITGMGSHSTMHPHHRPSVADGIEDPVPGLLAGGPNPGRQDHCQYAFTEPETAYLDQDAAYASNEIAINWNAPLVYLSAAIEALQYQAGYSRGAGVGVK
jgi:endoglucanase